MINPVTKINHILYQLIRLFLFQHSYLHGWYQDKAFKYRGVKDILLKRNLQSVSQKKKKKKRSLKPENMGIHFSESWYQMSMKQKTCLRWWRYKCCFGNEDAYWCQQLHKHSLSRYAEEHKHLYLIFTTYYFAIASKWHGKIMCDMEVQPASI